ncbi:hypothetical protein OXPF_41410 [Oxobacter pfennigii]|uniref:Uncharacterized protein n=1 Tax=Oxobacter pfennigii TaxID=36849 RepID=A0A0P8Y7B2_9CLOT|nr:hypothetical protein [Oxobacter pfennigii]KPU42356.1 hypothetical protein OXPF_41410 [Oxobacter pfennigii]
MAGGNVGNITARANVASCRCSRGGSCVCDNFQTNEIGVNNGRNLTATEDVSDIAANNNTTNAANNTNSNAGNYNLDAFFSQIY